MTISQWEALAAGFLFGIWPLVILRSGLKGSAAAFVLVAGCTIVLLPFAWQQGFAKEPLSVFLGSLPFIAGAAACAAFGLIIFFRMIQAPTAELGRLFILEILAQTAVAAAYDIVVSKSITLEKGTGFAAAAVAVYLLAR